MKFQPPKGTRDLLPEDAVKFQKLISIVQEVFEKYGFGPLYFPAFESFELLSAKGGLGEAVKDEIYYFKDKGNRELGLRFDLTIPLARIISSNPQIPKPFKRYAIDKVWRYDNPQALRWREFWQADIDVIGSNSLLADVECLAAICEILDKLGFKDYSIRINNRKIMEEVIENSLGKEKVVETFRIIDKLEKIGLDAVEKELKKLGLNYKPVLEILKMSIKDIEEKTKKYGLREGIQELKRLLVFSKQFGIEERLKIDFSLVRGLEYYTSVVFEVNLGAKVSCGGGGRYDNLMKTIGGVDLPATGISLGLDRIFEVMKSKGMFEEMKTKTDVFIASVDKKVLEEVVKISKRLRNSGINCQTDLMERNLSKQLEFADSQKIPFAMIIGEKEIENKKFKLKDMMKKKELELNIDEIESILKNYKKYGKDQEKL